mgnify:FL=1
MSKIRGNVSSSKSKKKTVQGSGLYTKKSNSGGENFNNNVRSGSPPSKAHRRKKPYKGQGR